MWLVWCYQAGILSKQLESVEISIEEDLILKEFWESVKIIKEWGHGRFTISFIHSC